MASENDRETVSGDAHHGFGGYGFWKPSKNAVFDAENAVFGVDQKGRESVRGDGFGGGGGVLRQNQQFFEKIVDFLRGMIYIIWYG